MNALWGAHGYIGSSLYDKKRHMAIFHGEKLSLPGVSLPKFLKGVIWAAGWPGNRNVDDVERNPIRSSVQNVWEPLELAHRCSDAGKRLLVLCSGCIYDGLNAEGLPHKESDLPNFTQTVYLRHQLQRSERLISEFGKIVTIFRIRVPFDSSHHPRNTLHKLAQMSAVWDKDQSYTWLPDLAIAIKAWEDGIIDRGIWHVTQPGIMNNYEAVKEWLNPNVKPIAGGDRPDKSMLCPRSAAILDSSKIQKVISMIPISKVWEMSCRNYLKHS